MDKPRRYKSKRIFDFTWSPNLAYAVGLITTDGCLSNDRRHVIFTSQDLEMIRNMKLILRNTDKVCLTKNSRSEAYRIQPSNVQLYDWLFSIGLTPHKSLTIGAIDVPDRYFVDFLRGHLDGDGSIQTYTDFYNTTKNPKYVYERIFVKFISASKNHIVWLHEKIVKNLGVHGAVHMTKEKDPKKNPMHIIKFAKKESLKLLPQLYYSDSVPCLSCKKILYTDFLKNI
jgi:hypothetical protein